MSLTNRLISIESAVPNENFNIVLYTGNGGTQSITGVGFQPDFVWIKGRTFAVIHGAYDSTRGATKYITPSLSIAEGTYSTVLNAFGADGFTVGSNGGVNANGEDYVAWCWKANGGTTSSNTDGSVTSTVQANSNLGFSIVKYTGTGGNATIGHGLGTTPEMMIIKNLDQPDPWVVYRSELGTADWVSLDATFAASGTGTIFGTPNDVGVAPTSTVFTVGSNHKSGASGEDYIAYCFNSVSSYSKFGSYTGTGSSGNAQSIGFQPDFILGKSYDNTEDWFIVDSTRGGNKYLKPNTDSAEATAGAYITFTSTGFEFTGGSFNNSGMNFIYMAFKIN